MYFPTSLFKNSTCNIAMYSGYFQQFRRNDSKVSTGAAAFLMNFSKYLVTNDRKDSRFHFKNKVDLKKLQNLN